LLLKRLKREFIINYAYLSKATNRYIDAGEELTLNYKELDANDAVDTSGYLK